MLKILQLRFFVDTVCNSGARFPAVPRTTDFLVYCGFCLQTEYHMFVEEFKKNPGQIWIMKPVAKSQGKGIFLFRKLKDIVDWKKVFDTFSLP